ncbi:MAG: LysE family transporter [Bacteroidetes bacterium]|nr:LysE family transporter [Bacteroidota bacterium]
MYHIYVFLVGFVFSFIGSIPPGTLNVSILQLALEKKVAIATRFAFAVAIIEYPYAWIGVQFQYWLTTSPVVLENFQIIAAVVMTALGIFNLWPSKESTSGFAKKFNDSGFRRGLLLSLLNPMAIPYWMGFTAYLKAQGWINLGTVGLLHSYVFGTSIGVLVLLWVLIHYAKRLAPYAQGSRWLKIIPGLVLLSLGIYAWIKYFLG